MKKLLTFLLIVLCIGSYAQIKFEPGYFISNNNIRTECLIKNAATYNNPVSFEYKLNESDDVLIGKINDVKEFAVGEGYHYKRFEVNVDQSSNVAGKMSTSKDPEWKKETIFLKLLVQSDVNLYQYENANQTRYFISSGNHEKAEQLVFKEYVTRDTGSSVFANNFYKRQLFMALKSPNLKQSDFEKLKYNKDSLMKLFLKYSNQEGKTFSNLEEKQNKSKINFKANLGIEQANINVESLNYVFNDFSSSATTFRVGVELEAILPFGQNKWSLFIAPNYQSFKTEGPADVRNSAIDLEAKVDYNFLQIPFGIRHYFFINKSKIFLNAGANVNLPLSSTIHIGGEKNDIEKSTGLFAGLGYNYNKYSFELRYNPKQNLYKISSFQAQYSTIGIIASYNFL
ncbi:hypothetical protein ACI6PS_12175 [Flavobacterium sp. PLA-1-15]|uniref:hypothetical protein n=1 Tax=Flavobacterium sp. PLA-1-15 TaxID=3380533 RepID=UPI003B78A9A7